MLAALLGLAGRAGCDTTTATFYGAAELYGLADGGAGIRGSVTPDDDAGVGTPSGAGGTWVTVCDEGVCVAALPFYGLVGGVDGCRQVFVPDGEYEYEWQHRGPGVVETRPNAPND